MSNKAQMNNGVGKDNLRVKKTIDYTRYRNIVILAIICTVLWGSAYPCIKSGYELFLIPAGDISSKILFAGYRFSIAGIMTIIFATFIHRKIIRPSKRNFLGILLLGFVQTCIQYIFFYIGLSNTTGVKGSILNASGTFMAVILAHFFCKNDRLNRNKIIGCTIGFVGIVIVNSGDSDSFASFSLTGEGFILLAALSFAIGSLISKKIASNGDSMIITGYQLFLGGIMLLLIGAVSGGHLDEVTIKGMILLIYMSGLSAVAFTIWTILLKYNKMGKISIYNFLVPIFGTIMSGVFLKESIWNMQFIIALLCVCMGIYTVNRLN